jgi:hypothetical protein
MECKTTFAVVATNPDLLSRGQRDSQVEEAQMKMVHYYFIVQHDRNDHQTQKKNRFVSLDAPWRTEHPIQTNIIYRRELGTKVHDIVMLSK